MIVLNSLFPIFALLLFGALLKRRGLSAWTIGAIERGRGEATCEVVR